MTAVVQANTMCSGHARDTGEPLGSIEGLTQDDLVKNKHGEVVSKKKSTLGTKVVG